MSTVKVLIPGYAKQTEGENWKVSATTSLVKAKGLNIIVDPGVNRELLLKKLKEENLETGDIDFVMMTHTHPDHNYLSGIFENAKALDDEIVYDEDKTYEHGGKVPGTNLKIISTPGHDPFHASLVVPTEEGTVVIAGDVFWWKDEEEQVTTKEELISHQDPYVKNKEALEESRKKVLKIADYIIPGHGDKFKVE